MGYCKASELAKKNEIMEAGIYLREGVIPTDVTVDRVRYVADMLASGKSNAKCRKYIKEEYGVKDDRTIDSYMTAAYRFITPQNWDEEKERLVTKNIRTLEKIVEKSMDKESYRMAKEAIDSLNKMFGIGGQNSVTIAKNKNGEEMINISFD